MPNKTCSLHHKTNKEKCKLKDKRQTLKFYAAFIYLYTKTQERDLNYRIVYCKRNFNDLINVTLLLLTINLHTYFYNYLKFKTLLHYIFVLIAFTYIPSVIFWRYHQIAQKFD